MLKVSWIPNYSDVLDFAEFYDATKGTRYSAHLSHSVVIGDLKLR